MGYNRVVPAVTMQHNIMSLYSEIQDEFQPRLAAAARAYFGEGVAPPKAQPKAEKPAKPKKKSIPKVVKDLSWNKWVGEDVARTKCLCCGVNEIKMSSFHCGHVVAEANGGTTTVDNLRPICAACNTSMGTENLNEFKAKCGFGGAEAPKAAAPAPAPAKPPKVVKAKAPKAVVPVIPKVPTRIEQLVSKGDLKPCPGKQEEYQNLGDLFPRSKCSTSSFSRHCDSCGYHFHYIAGYTRGVCPCKG